MKVLILSPGTRGDVAPATGLGAAFVADGHQATIVANIEYEPLVTAAGCTLAPITTPLGPEGDESGDAPSGARAHLAALRNYMDQAATAALDAAPGAEAVLTNAISPYGHDIAEALGVPSVDALLQPWQPSAAYPPVIFSQRSLGRTGNRLAGRIAQQVPTPYDPACARIRSKLGLPPRTRRATQRRRRAQGHPVHHGISPAVLPRPADWPAHLTLDGFWQSPTPEDWSPPAELCEFLDAGPAPVVITLGSISPNSAALQAVEEALQSIKERAIVQGGPQLRSIVDRLERPDVIHVGDVPHLWLLPRAAAVVHHAGAGITATALQAAIPSVPLPMHTDQPFWARRLAALGAATDPIPIKGVDGPLLAAAITHASANQRLRDGARAVRQTMHAEAGTQPLREWLRRAAG
ncbi:glycosyltransferase [Streptomyces sp. NPDC015125]|uniref:glycosyltransferase n=1 Tax=Streptomyces sp. NPDC015125 TaxID=3364938 RepID=UPI0036F70228